MSKTPKTNFCLTKALIFIPIILLLQSYIQTKLNLISPKGGITIYQNTPTLSWTKVPCDYYKVYVDGILTDSVRPALNASVPFPLSFGKHSWYVIAYTKNNEIKSETAEFTLDDKPLIQLPEEALLLRNNWKVQSTYLVKGEGAKVSGPLVDTKNWYSTSIPATVLTVLVRNGVYPDPYVGTNNMRIPDSNDKYNTDYNLLKFSHISGRNPWCDPYWYRTEFDAPVSYKGKKVWLTFSEINYRAEVWLNGKKLADSSEIVGMEQTFRFDISSLVKLGSKNILAVAIYPVDVPGEPGNEPLTPLGEPGTNMGDGLISKNYAKWDVLGWDWQPAVRDRDMGITEDVFIYATNPIEINNLYVTSDLPLPDTTLANISISADIVNHSKASVKGVAKITLSFQNEQILIHQPYTVAANKAYSFLLNSKNQPELTLKNPKLWWPHGYGEQNLYKLQIELVEGGKTVASTNAMFGVREVETNLGAKERVFKINGREIYCKGGNWVVDMMLNWTAKRYEDEILLTRNSNLNMLRVWGPTGVPPQAFFDAADKYGILIWQDFLNDFWGTFKNTPGYTPNDKLYEKATIEVVKKCRNHPSLIMWCGGNEGPNPREKLITQKILPQYDGRDSKYYLKQSDGDGLHGGGPYHTLSPAEYFIHRKLNGFSSEIGPSGVPVYESVVKFMPNLGQTWMEGRFPIDGVWAYHDANDWPGSDSRKFSSYDNILREQYGSIATFNDKGIVEYLAKAQLVNYDVYRASIEAINKQLWSNSSGILLWKSNSSWPSMTWQVYDWYLQAHAGYYGVKMASEPVHIQYNRDSSDVVILNTRGRQMPDTKVSANLYSLKLDQLWHQAASLTLAQNGLTKTGWTVPVAADPCFLKLEVKDNLGRGVSRNFYWLSKNDNYQMLNSLPKAEIEVIVKKVIDAGKTRFLVTLTNNKQNIAFMIACKLVGETSGQELLPTFWSNNYVSLLPGETISLEATIDSGNLTETAVVSYKAYNMDQKIITIAE